MPPPAAVFSPFRRGPWRGVPGSGSTVLPIPAAPSTPSTPSPADTATLRVTKLTWVAAGATQADVYLDTVTPPVAIAVPKFVGTSYAPTLLPGTRYYWKIVAFNAGGSAAGPIWSFTTPAATAVLFSLAGVDIAARVPFPSGLTIHDALHAAPNTASLELRGAAVPIVGQAIAIGLGTLDATKLLFGGTVQDVGQSYIDTPTGLPVWPLTLIDYTWTLNKRRPFGTWVTVSATTIAQALVTQYAPGFTATHVEAGLPVVSITFDGAADFMTCLGQLAAAASTTGAPVYADVDYSQDVWLFATRDPTDPAPDPLDPTHPPLNVPPIAFSTDLSQVRTRVYGKGNSQTVPADVAIRETILPVADASYFTGTGGQVIAGTTSGGAQSQQLTYTGVQVGGVGSLVGPGAAPSVAPSLAPVAGTGLGTGAYQYAYTDVTAAGESLPSPLGSITTGVTAAPASAPTAGTPTIGTGPDPGSHDYAVTFVTASGETTPGPSLTKATGLTAAPSTSLTPGTATAGAGVDAGTHDYAVSFLTSIGETTTSPISAQVTITDIAVPVAPTILGGTGTGGGPFGVGTYLWAWTFITSFGETSAGATISYSAANGLDFITFSAPLGPTGVTSRKLYRTVVNGSQLKLVGTLSNNTTTSLNDSSTDASLGVNVPTVNLAVGHQIPLTAVPLGDANCTSRKIYRRSGGLGMKLLATIANNTGTTYTDTTANTSLGAASLSTSTAYLQRIPLSSIPLNALATSRKIYRTAAGATQLKLVTTLADNTTTTFTDTVTDASLGANAPSSNTAIANQVALAGIASGASPTSSRKVYRTAVGASQLKLLTTLADNTTTIFADSTADGSLGANAPTADTSGLTQPSGQVNAGSPSLLTASPAPFLANGGWVILSGGQTVRYTGISGNTLTGIPTSGPGSITSTVLYGSQAIPSPALTGLNANNGLALPMAKGASVAIWVQRDDLAAQTALGLLERDALGNPTDGIHEYTIIDGRRGEASLIAACDADLAVFSRPIVSVTYQTRDTKTRSGKTVSIHLTVGIFDPAIFDPAIFDVTTAWGLVGNFTIQSVDVAFDGPALAPRARVQASSVSFTLDDLLRKAVLAL